MSDKISGADLNELKALLIKKKELLTLILNLTKEQPAHIAGDEVEGLMDNLAARQKLVDEIDLLDGAMLKLGPLETPDPQIGAVYGEIKNILLAIKAQDAENEKAALERKGELQNQIKKLNQLQKNSGAYEASNQSGATYFDKTK